MNLVWLIIFFLVRWGLVMGLLYLYELSGLPIVVASFIMALLIMEFEFLQIRIAKRKKPDDRKTPS